MKRLTRDEIADVLRRGSRVHGLLCTYATLPRDVAGVSVVVSKKVGATAVLRNRVKRRMRAAAHSAHTAHEQCALVMIAKPGAATAPTHALATELTNRLGRRV